MSSELETQKLITNIENFKKLIREKTPDSKSTKLLELVNAVEEELILAPASTRTEYHGAFTGGLVDHSLQVVKTMVALKSAYGANITPEEIVTTGLFHDIGKVGNLTKPYYLVNNSDWHNKQGIFYTVNPEIPNYPVSLRSLFLLQSFGVKLSEAEHYAISSIRDRHYPGEDSLPINNEPLLAIILQQAVKMTCHKNKGKTSFSKSQ